MGRSPQTPAKPRKIRLPNLSKWRRYRKKSQHKLAVDIGVTQGMISQWENGRADLTLETVDLLARALETSPQQLQFSLPGRDNFVAVWESLPESEQARALRLLRSLKEPNDD
jgi:transcriptional regulator with XRE-family HTH domain